MKRLRVLVIDDSQADLWLLKEALATTGTPTEVATAESGEMALSLLHRADVPKPDIVILDINMPRLSGHDVLRDIKSDDDLKSTVVLMFSSSRSKTDVAQAYELKTNGYVVKPTNLEGYFNRARSVTDFWSRVATLPIRGIAHATYDGARLTRPAVRVPGFYLVPELDLPRLWFGANL
jgi:CheY-like chemotaxis protein